MKDWYEGLFKPEEKSDLQNWLNSEPIIFKGGLISSAETAYGTPVDVVAMDRDKVCYSVELKTRYKMYDEVFIEPKKWDNMLRLWRQFGVVPLYINFFNDETYVWNLARITAVTFYPNVRLYPGDPVKEEVVDRIGLKTENAWLYKNGEKQRNPEGIGERMAGTPYGAFIFNNEINKKNIFTIWEKKDLQ